MSREIEDLEFDTWNEFPVLYFGIGRVGRVGRPGITEIVSNGRFSTAV